MGAIDEYREGYEQGQEDSQNPGTQGISVIAQGLAGGLHSDAYNKGLNDGRAGRSFDPPDED